jgi:integrase
LILFKYALKAPETRRQWPRRLKVFFDFLEMEGASLLEEQARLFVIKTRQRPPWAQDSLIRFMTLQRERVWRGEISESTIPNYYKATKLFCEMNDIVLNWKKILCGLPRVKQAANDRAPTLEEIQKLVEFPDRRIKPIIYTMASSGIRIGSWEYLRWKHIEPIRNDQGDVIAARLTVYADEREQYFCFITPEAVSSLIEWMEFRASYGEKITGESWLMRDIWQTTNLKYGAKRALATSPRKLKSSGIKRLIEHALWEQGIRQPLKDGAKRHEWKAAHGFRKFYKSRAEQVMKPINVELTMGHNIGISASYYRPTEQEILQDYLKAIDPLTINGEKTVLLKQVKALKETNEDSEYLVKAKLQEKDDQIKTMQDQFTQLQSQVQLLMSSISTIDQASKNELARKMYEEGIYTPAERRT